MTGTTAFKTDFRIDPLSGDYDGAVVSDLSNAIYLRITTPLGSYWQDPTFGSLLYTLERSKDLPSVKLLAQKYVLDALQPLISSGRATSIQIEVDDPVENNGTARLFMRVSVYQHGVLAAQYQHHIKVMQA